MKPLCIAHRGCHWHCFENTIQAFEAAKKGDFYGVEMDIHLTKDKKWIIHHDPDFLSNGVKHVIKEERCDDLLKLPLDLLSMYELVSIHPTIFRVLFIFAFPPLIR